MYQHCTIKVITHCLAEHTKWYCWQHRVAKACLTLRLFPSVFREPTDAFGLLWVQSSEIQNNLSLVQNLIMYLPFIFIWQWEVSLSELLYLLICKSEFEIIRIAIIIAALQSFSAVSWNLLYAAATEIIFPYDKLQVLFTTFLNGLLLWCLFLIIQAKSLKTLLGLLNFQPMYFHFVPKSNIGTTIRWIAEKLGADIVAVLRGWILMILFLPSHVKI